jgi:ribosomal protein S18 acetylase RimI-like enzyme
MEANQAEGQPGNRLGWLSVDPLPFTDGTLLEEEHIPIIYRFTCAKPGEPETRFEQDVSEWLKDLRAGAMMAVKLGLSEVRLFFCPDTNALMGYGAIGMETWTFPDGAAKKLWILQFAGVHTKFRFQAGVDSNARFGRRLLAGMLREVQMRGGCEHIGLFVDPGNPAKDKYRNDLGFETLDVEMDGDRQWVRMVRKL